jgi:hypothetical protein
VRDRKKETKKSEDCFFLLSLSLSLSLFYNSTAHDQNPFCCVARKEEQASAVAPRASAARCVLLFMAGLLGAFPQDPGEFSFFFFLLSLSFCRLSLSLSPTPLPHSPRSSLSLSLFRSISTVFLFSFCKLNRVREQKEVLGEFG